MLNYEIVKWFTKKIMTEMKSCLIHFLNLYYPQETCRHLNFFIRLLFSASLTALGEIWDPFLANKLVMAYQNGFWWNENWKFEVSFAQLLRGYSFVSRSFDTCRDQISRKVDNFSFPQSSKCHASHGIHWIGGFLYLRGPTSSKNWSLWTYVLNLSTNA